MWIDITPVAKPRQTRSDVWKKRPCVLKYRQFADDLREAIGKAGFIVGNQLYMEFHIPMPKSWSKKKKGYMNGSAHQQRPDLDNYLKAWKDSVYEEDAIVWRVKASKLWTDGTGHIVVNYL